MVAHSGRLELTWTNKYLALLSAEDGSYEWVDPADVRVGETRMLHEVAEVGEWDPSDPPGADNLLIQGDSLQVLRSLRRLPEYAANYVGKVRLIYIDPPFNTGQAFVNYDDALEHSVWLTMMRDRLVELKQLLAPDGSIWVHLDDSEVHRLRCVMDEVFGASRFVATVIWQKRYSRDNRPAIGGVHDSLLVYAPAGGNWKKHRNRIPRTQAEEYRYRDERGRWRGIPMTAQGFRPNQMYEIVSPAGVVHTPPKGRCWSMVRERFDELLAEGRIYFGKDGSGQPNVIRYLDEDRGLVPWSWWPADEVGHNDESKKEMLELYPDVEAFDTPKPERLMQRIIHISTQPGDVVLDCFAGSGTTAAVAQKMGRSWIAIEREASTIEVYTRPRLEKVVKGEDPGGITDAVGWEGGGRFRVLQLGDSMYEIGSDGEVFLSPRVTNGQFAAAVRAQLGFAGEEEPPFCGRKGRARLAVVDGVVGDTEIRHVVAALGPGERLVLVAKAIDDDAERLPSELSPGSRLLKAPRDLLRSSGRVVR